MKKLILAFAFFCATSVVFANTPLKEDSSKKEDKIEISGKPKVSVKCSKVVAQQGNVTILVTMKAGNIFTSAIKATEKCYAKLDKIN